MTKHTHRKCSQCRTIETRSSSGLCFNCRPAPSVEIDGDLCRIGGAFELPAAKAMVLAHRILDSLTPQISREQK